MNDKEYITTISKMVDKMTNLPNIRFWAIWAIFALLALGYVLGQLAAFVK